MNKLLLEIGTEEMPSEYIEPATRRLAELIQKRLTSSLLPFKTIKTFATPRRLAVVVDGVPDLQESGSKKVAGPPTKVAIDKDGNPTKAGLGFAKKFGVDFSQVKKEETDKGEYLYLEIKEGGGKSIDILKTELPKIILEIPFPKSMRWGNKSIRFARPLRSIIALFGREIIPFEIEKIKSGNQTFGHRFLSDGVVTIKNIDSYEKTLLENFVIALEEKRKEKITKEIKEIEKLGNISVIEDKELLSTICNLTEFPVAVVGSFDKKYLELPRELLTTVMRYHQKYFAVEDKNKKITNKFIAFSNINGDGIDTIRKGFERVLSARLNDARFFYDEDRKKTLEEFTEGLDGITYQKKLGTVADKCKRVGNIAKALCPLIAKGKEDAVKTASRLAKADLTTLMVYEFPELQGVMGREYAKAEGIDEEIAVAIDEHYRPRFSGDLLPSNDIATCVAIADKIETITAFFAIGKVPTGSEDPFSLRRHALGIIRILLKSDTDVSITKIIELGILSLPEKIVADKEKITKEITSFLAGRIKADFTSNAIPYDVIDAVLSVGFDSLPLTLKRCEALAQMKEEEYSQNLSITFKRAVKIVADNKITSIDESLLKEDVEQKLFASIKSVEEKITPLIDAGEFKSALQEIASIRGDVDSFFDGVMVMDEDEKIKNNRLAILSKLTGLFNELADFSKLVFK